MKIRPFQSQTGFSCFLGIFRIYQDFLDKTGHVQKCMDILGEIMDILGEIMDILGENNGYFGRNNGYFGRNNGYFGRK